MRDYGRAAATGSEPVPQKALAAWRHLSETGLVPQLDTRPAEARDTPGGLVMNDNAEPDYLESIRNPAHGIRSMTLPIRGGTELSP